MMQPDDMRGCVQSVDRALALLEILGGSDNGVRLTDLVDKTGMAASTIHRLLTTLEQRNFIHADPRDRRWHIGRQAFSIGSAFVRERAFVATALPVLRHLRDQTHETANLGIVDSGSVVVLSQVESHQISRPIASVGSVVPMTTSAMGKAIMASYTPDDVDAVLAQDPLWPRTPKSVTSRSALEEHLIDVRQRGYAVDDEEHTRGVRCVASAVYANSHDPLFAISVSGLASRLTPDRIAHVGQMLLQAARGLSRQLQ